MNAGSLWVRAALTQYRVKAQLSLSLIQMDRKMIGKADANVKTRKLHQLKTNKDLTSQIILKKQCGNSHQTLLSLCPTTLCSKRFTPLTLPTYYSNNVYATLNGTERIPPMFREPCNAPMRPSRCLYKYHGKASETNDPCSSLDASHWVHCAFRKRNSGLLYDERIIWKK